MSYEGLKLGHYQLLQLVGQGGMSEVYLAEDQSLHRQVAIKVIRSEPEQTYGMYEKQESIRLFKREMQLLASFDHPNILPIYEADEQSINGKPLLYMVTPYRKEGSLDDWLRQHGSYQVTATNPSYFIYCPDRTPFINFVFEVQMTITQGDCGGVVFRDTKGILGYSYLFEVCQKGTYSLSLFHNNDTPQALIPSQPSAAIHKGYFQTNTIAVVANGSQLTLYVNYQNVGQKSDNTYNGGEVGVVAFPVSQSTGVIYQDAKVWSL